MIRWFERWDPEPANSVAIAVPCWKIAAMKLGGRTVPILALLFAIILCAGWASAAEFRGIWVDAFGPGFFNAQQVKKLAEDCRKYNFNAVFVEMRRRGDAFYHPQPPNTDPRTSIITTNFDALAEIIKQCHTGLPRIQVHCWVVSHFIWAFDKPPAHPNHIFNTHPEYLTKDSIGQKRLAKNWYLTGMAEPQGPLRIWRSNGRCCGGDGTWERKLPGTVGKLAGQGYCGQAPGIAQWWCA